MSGPWYPRRPLAPHLRAMAHTGSSVTEETNRQAVALADMERLESDLRVLSPVGIERVAWGWDLHEQDNLTAFHAAEKSALEAIDAAGQTEAWDEWRRRLFYEFEGRLAFSLVRGLSTSSTLSTRTRLNAPRWARRWACSLDRGLATSSTPRWSARWPRHCPGCCPSGRRGLRAAGKRSLPRWGPCLPGFRWACRLLARRARWCWIWRDARRMRGSTG